ncbi:MAG: PASTA domain-containing protein, partial [Streptosporangiaceae bacterium]
AAHAKLSAAGLAFNTDTAKDKPGYDRIVSKQNPAAGTAATSATKVSLTWSYVKAGSTAGGGSGTVKVPGVTGTDLNSAHSRLAAAGLSYNADNSKDKTGYVRRVTAQDPKAGASAARGTKVTLTWSYVKS